MDIKSIYYYEILAKNETTYAARYLKSLNELISRWHKNRKRAVRLLDDNARAYRHTSIASWIEQKVSNVDWNPLILTV